MVGVLEIGSALNSLKTAFDLAKTLNGVGNIIEVKAITIELQGAILAAQSSAFEAREAQTALLKRIEDLEQEIVQFKDWSAQKKRYELRGVGRGAVVYMLKPGMENGEEAHWLCPNCFAHERKSFMQFKGQDRRVGGGNADTSNYACDTCGSAIKVHYTLNPDKMNSTRK